MEEEIERWNNIKTDGKTDKWRNKQTDRLIDGRIDRQRN